MDEQIREHETAIAKLKRTRNSLLNVYKIPPEVLGKIFGWNVTYKDDFGGLQEGSHNFLLICHHWFEVALCTPELWSFWGNTTKDWARWYRRSRTAPLDLVLDYPDYDNDGSFDITLCNTLQDRATQDAIRRIHLKSADSELLSSIILPLTANSKGLRSNSLESLVLRNDGTGKVEISDFFAHYRFPKLQHLELFDCTISSWDLIISRTSILTTLDLDLSYNPTPATSQLLSILASNPTLRKVSLSGLCKGPGNDGNPSPRVSLHHLKDLELVGDSRDVFGLLHQLDLPRDMENLDVNLDDCTLEDISRDIGPCLWDYLRRRGGSQSGLGLSLSSPGRIVLRFGDVGGIDFSAPTPARMSAFATIAIESQRIPEELREKMVRDLIAHIPREEIVYFQTYGEYVTMEDVSTQLPNLRGLYIKGSSLSAAFPKSNLDRGKEVFPSLQYVCLDWVIKDGDDLSLLVTFLDRRTSSGSRLHTLVIVGPYHEDLELASWILKGMVKSFGRLGILH